MKFATRHLKLIAVVAVAVIMGVVAMPNSWKQAIPVQAVQDYLLEKKANFGLDLVGGRQIAYKVDMSEVALMNNDDDPDNDRDSDEVLNNIRDILRRRIDPQGTRELNIYTSQFDDENYVIVELTSDLDNQATLDTLQQVISLEFKEQGGEEPEEARLEELQQEADTFLAEGTVENFEEKAQQVQNRDTVRYNDVAQYWRDDLDGSFDEATGAAIWEAEASSIMPWVIGRTSNTFVQSAEGFELQEIQEFVVIKVGEKQIAERENREPGEDFATVQEEISTHEVGKEPLLNTPEAFQDALLELDYGTTSQVLESDSEYAIFRIIESDNPDDIETYVIGIYVSKETPDAAQIINTARERVEQKVTITEEEQITLSEVVFSLPLQNWKDTGLGGMQFKRARVAQDPNTGQPLVEILFNDEGAIMFEEITARNVGKPLAIFVGGELISAPNINEKISGGAAVITMGVGNYIEARKQATALAQGLNGGATPVPFEEAGQFKIGATLGSTGLSKSLTAGAIGLAILSLYMIVMYRFMGFLAVLALGFYAIFIVFLLKSHVSFGIAGIIGTIVFTIGLRSFWILEKNELLALVIALILGMMTTVIANSSIVLTLAGVAGIVLSIGMAVDANVLIFERVKEEVAKGKNFSSSVAIGFERAWSSIRDSNLSSLITCMILWIFGSAVIKGFAAALAMGIIISMLTAITVTRTLIESLVSRSMAQKTDVLIGKKKSGQ